MNNNLQKEPFVVVANSVNEKNIIYTCPNCLVLKNGRILNYNEKKQKIYNSAKQKKHIHGSNANLNNRTEYRTSHCPFYKGTICIIIDDSTIKYI